MDNSGHREDKIKTAQRLQFFDRLSRPKTPKHRSRGNVVEVDALVVQRKDGGRHTVQRNYVQSDIRRKPNIMEEVRSMLFSDDGAAKPSHSSLRSQQPSATPQSPARHRSTPKNEISQRINQPNLRPSTPKMQNRSTAMRSRPKTPDLRRGMQSRQEKVTSSGESKKSPEPLDKESRMLREFEREYAENQKVLAASGNSVEDSRSWKEVNEDRTEYDYNGRRIGKKSLQSKSSSHIRSKSAPRMNKVSSRHYEAKNQTRKFDDSMSDSEDSEVAMAMGGGAKNNDQGPHRSRSVDDFLDERGPKPRKDKHECRKSRIPTPVHFNSGRKSAMGALSHDCNSSKSAIRSNIDGVASHELQTSTLNRGQRSTERTRRGREPRNVDHTTEKQRHAGKLERHEPVHGSPSRKENIQPLSPASRMDEAEEYDLDNLELFKFGRHGKKKKKAHQKHTEDSPGRSAKLQSDFVDGRQHYYHKEDIMPGYVENYLLPNSGNYNSNMNNSNNSNAIGRTVGHLEESVRPRHGKNGYQRSNLYSSVADLLKSDPSSNQVHSYPNELTNQRSPHQPTKIQNSLSACGQQYLPSSEQHYSGVAYGMTAGTAYDQASPQQPAKTKNPSSTWGQQHLLLSEQHHSSITSGTKPGIAYDQSQAYTSAARQPMLHDYQPNHRIPDTATGIFHYMPPPGPPRPAIQQQQDLHSHEPASANEETHLSRFHKSQHQTSHHHPYYQASGGRQGDGHGYVSSSVPVTLTHDSRYDSSQHRSQEVGHGQSKDRMLGIGHNDRSHQCPSSLASGTHYSHPVGYSSLKNATHHQSNCQSPGDRYQADISSRSAASVLDGSQHQPSPYQSSYQLAGNNYQSSGHERSPVSSVATSSPCSGSTTYIHQSNSYQASGANQFPKTNHSSNASSTNAPGSHHNYASPDNTGAQYQSQDSSICEQEIQDNENTMRETVSRSDASGTRISKRHNFNYFFTDRYLKDVIGKKSAPSKPESTHQSVYDPVTDEQLQRSKDENLVESYKKQALHPRSYVENSPRNLSHSIHKESSQRDDQEHSRNYILSNSASLYPNMARGQHPVDNISLRHKAQDRRHGNYKLGSSDRENKKREYII